MVYGVFLTSFSPFDSIFEACWTDQNGTPCALLQNGTGSYMEILDTKSGLPD